LFPKAIIALLSLIDYIGIIIFFDAKRNQVAFLFTDCTHSSFLKTHAPIPPTAHAVGFLGAGFVKELSGESTLSIKRLASCCGDFPKLREPLFLYAVFSGQLQTLRSALQAESNESLQKLCDDFGDIVTLNILQKKLSICGLSLKKMQKSPFQNHFRQTESSQSPDKSSHSLD